MNYKKLLLFVVALVFVIVAIFALSDDMFSPYVPFEKAKASPGKLVQIIGSLDQSQKVIHTEKDYTFTLKEKGDTIRVVHRDLKPMNFEHAEEAVVLGRYDTQNKIFVAEKVLVKCPSKYEKASPTKSAG